MPEDLPARVAVLEEIARSTRDTLNRLDHRFDTLEARIDARFAEVNGRIGEVNGRIDRLAAIQWSQFRWMLGIMLGGFSLMLSGFAGMLAAMAHGFHWL